MQTKTLSPSWVDTQLYPFEHKYLRLSAGNMHYVDQGQGEVLLFVHGTPTWSFLFRNHIQALSKHYRCIAIDHLGFGLSQKQASYLGTPEWHAKNLREFIFKLDLQNITLVVHDFGGPIGLSAGMAYAENIKRVVLMNSWLWATKDIQAVQKIDRTLNSWLGRFLYLSLNFSPKVLLKKGFSEPKKLSKAVHQQYIQPFPDKSARETLLRLAQSLLGSSDWYQKQWERLDLLADKPWLILWGTEDPFFSIEYVQKWAARLPDAKIHQWACGHFVPEEKAEETARAIMSFLKGEP